MRVLDRFHIDRIKGEDSVQMLVRVVVFRDVSEIIDIGETEILRLREIKDSLTFGGGEELSFVVEKLQGVPLAWVVRGCEDDPSVGLGESHGHLCGRC